MESTTSDPLAGVMPRYRRKTIRRLGRLIRVSQIGDEEARLGAVTRQMTDQTIVSDRRKSEGERRAHVRSVMS